MTTTSTSDRIQKQLVLRAAPARVWRAIASAREFGAWFGIELHGEFVAGAPIHGTASYQGSPITLTFHVERIEPERAIAFRWHPYAVDPDVDYTREPTTLVELELAPAPEGTLLTVTESGFDQLPLGRRARAFEMNDHGWTEQMKNIARHVHA